MKPEVLEKRRELEQQWEDYENRRAVFMKKMCWDERRMAKHEAVCSKRFFQEEPSGMLMLMCYAFTIVPFFLLGDLRDFAFKMVGAWLVIFCWLVPAVLAHFIHWLSKQSGENVPEFVPLRSREERADIQKVRLEVERSTAAIRTAYYDLGRYVAPHWIRKAESDLKAGLLDEAEALNHLAGIEMQFDDWQGLRAARCLPSWPRGAARVDKDLKSEHLVRKAWYEKHRERASLNDRSAISLREKRHTQQIKSAASETAMIAPVSTPAAIVKPSPTSSSSSSQGKSSGIRNEPVKDVQGSVVPVVAKADLVPPTQGLDGLGNNLSHGVFIAQKSAKPVDFKPEEVPSIADEPITPPVIEAASTAEPDRFDFGDLEADFHEPERPNRPPRTRSSLKGMGEDEVEPVPGIEGGRVLRTTYAVVRNPKLRAAAVQIHGRSCCVCDFNFDAFFGEDLAQGYIEIHHLSQISVGERTTDPATDLAPLCANCHAMADRLARNVINPPATIEALKAMLIPSKYRE